MPAHHVHSAPRRTVAPVAYPVSLDEAKDELDILDDTTFDAKVTRHLEQAIDQVERDSGMMLMPQTWQLYLDHFPCEIELRRCPVASVSSLKYLLGGVLTTLSASYYTTDLISGPGRIRPVYNQVWPVTDCIMNAVQVEWIAGFANAAAVPPCAKAAVLYALKQNYYGCEIGTNYWSLIDRIKMFGFV
jgi:uncharacterized phiE125 gp8 family phage protein